jgi:carboxyl-terminal processing protease
VLPASNRGAGGTVGFPDVCLTPAVPAPIPVPYPNLGLNAMAAPFSPNVLFTGMPALNLMSMIPMTSGDEGGVAHPRIKGPARFTMGNPIVKGNYLPAISLTCPTTGNNMNNPLGAVLVPSITNVFLTASPALAPATGPLSQSDVDTLAEGLASARVEAHLEDGGLGVVRVGVFGFTTAADVRAAIQDLTRRAGEAGLAMLELDLRGSPGGDLHAACDVAADVLPLGAVVVRLVEGDGDETLRRARNSPLFPSLPLRVRIDGMTASAAEVLAAALQDHGRAQVVGTPSHGKGTAQRMLPCQLAPGADYATLATLVRPSGSPLDGAGVTPDRLEP